MAKKPKATTAAGPANLGPPLLTGNDVKTKLGQVSGGGLASQVNPELRNRIASSQQDLTDQYQRKIYPTLSRAAEQSGRYGSDAYQLQQGEAATGLTRALGDVESNMQFADYNARMQDMMQGLGLEAQLYGNDAQKDIALWNSQASAQSAGAGAAAQQAMFEKELQFKAAQAMQQGDLATMQMMLDASGQMGGMQQNALGNLPGLDQMGGMGFLSNMLSQSTGLDSAAINAMLGQQGLGLQRQGLNQDQQRINLAQQGQQYGQQMDALGFMNQNPWDMLSNYGNIVQGIGGQYGTTSQTGHNTTPYQGPSPFEAGIQGGLGAFNMFSGGMGGGQQQPARYNPAAAQYFQNW